jgi:hypothetical protein
MHDPYETPYIHPVYRDQRLRLFQQLHQDDDPVWHRSNGHMKCGLCGLPYRDHPVEEEYNVDHRLCDGRVVHL